MRSWRKPARLSKSGWGPPPWEAERRPERNDKGGNTGRRVVYDDIARAVYLP
jgi:hypothetical protein